MPSEAEEKKSGENTSEYLTKKDLDSLQSQLFGAMKRFVREGLDEKMSDFDSKLAAFKQSSQKTEDQKKENSEDTVTKELEETRRQVAEQREQLEKREKMIQGERKRNAVLGAVKDIDLMPGVMNDYESVLTEKVALDEETGQPYWPGKRKNDFGEVEEVRLPVADGIKSFFGERQHLVKAKTGGRQEISRPEKYSELISDPKALAHWYREDPSLVQRLRDKESPQMSKKRWGEKQ